MKARGQPTRLTHMKLNPELIAPEIPANVQFQIDDIMDNFDFEKAHKVMTLLDWRWLSSLDDSGKVPEIHELKACARRLLRNSFFDATKAKVKEYAISTGGFYAGYQYYEADKIHNFELKFVVAEWDTSY